MTELSQRSRQLRIETIRLAKANGGYHWGGCFSEVEILLALYDHLLTDLDAFILSKGHSCWPWYVLLREQGLNPELMGHPSRDSHNGILATTGSLGHGLPTGIGIAMARKIKADMGRVYVLLGDGECQEGTIWESLLIAAHHRLDNLYAIIDWNRCQGSGRVEDILPLPDMARIADICGWDVYQCNGHEVDEIAATMEVKGAEGKPRLLIAHTVKGKGISFMEDRPEWHAKWLDDKAETMALKELF